MVPLLEVFGGCLGALGALGELGATGTQLRSRILRLVSDSFVESTLNSSCPFYARISPCLEGSLLSLATKLRAYESMTVERNGQQGELNTNLARTSPI